MRKNRQIIAGLLLIVMFIVTGLFAPFLAPNDPNITDLTKISSESYTQMSNMNGFGAEADAKATQTYYMGYNLGNPIFGDQIVREAITIAVDKENVVNHIFGGLYEKADTFFAKSLPYCDVDQKIYEFDLDKSAALLDNAGYVDTDGDCPSFYII